MLRRTGTLVVLLAVLALLVFTVAPAFAHHKDGHEKGGGNGGSQAANHDDDAIADDDGDNKHPSGKDRETNDGPTDDEQGGSRTSNPDNDGHGPERNSCKNTSEDRVGGCADKPGGTGGVDDADQDWNNGCGNDDDFEDDNEGLCLGPPQPSPTPIVSGAVSPTDVCDEDLTTPGIQPCKDDEVKGAGEARADDDVVGLVETKPTRREDNVLGEQLFARPATVAGAGGQVVQPSGDVVQAAGAALPFTGSGALLPFLIVGLGLLGTGWVIVRRDA